MERRKKIRFLSAMVGLIVVGVAIFVIYDITTNTPTGGIRVVSAEMISPNTPAGPTIAITLRNEMGQSITSLRAVLEMSRNYTYGFTDISLADPLMQGQSTSDTETLINGGFITGQAYPLVIEGSTQDSNFTYITSTEITTG